MFIPLANKYKPLKTKGPDMKKKAFPILISLLIIFTSFLTACSDSPSEAENAAETEAAGNVSGNDEEETEEETDITDLLPELSAAEEDEGNGEDEGDGEGTDDYSDLCDLSYLDENNNITIPLSEISDEAIYAGYISESGTVMEIIVVESGGEIYYAANTCQVCSGSPYAYYVQSGSYFVCQNCGNSFSASRLGSAAGGCNPVAVDGVEISDEYITFSGEFLEEYESYFTNWKGINV